MAFRTHTVITLNGFICKLITNINKIEGGFTHCEVFLI
jgi:hypothetical protein